jgi:hypothetical protein
MRRLLAVPLLLIVALVLGAAPAGACGGLVAPNGAVQLVRTTTLAAHVDGVEHYVTSFEFASPEESFGSIVPLPGEPTEVERAGRWTLQRLVEEIQPVFLEQAAAEDGLASGAARNVEVLSRHQIGALDITIVRGGGTEVSEWAEERGFVISEDAPATLDFYSERSPYFMAARFDAEEARNDDFAVGDAIPVHLAIPTDDPWVPIHILALDKPGTEIVTADVFLLTEDRPALLGPDALRLERSEPASDLLLDDLRSDRRSEWVPDEAWFTYLSIDAPAADLDGDLAIDVDGNQPSPIDAGRISPSSLSTTTGVGGDGIGLPDGTPALLLLVAAVGVVARVGRRPRREA